MKGIGGDIILNCKKAMHIKKRIIISLITILIYIIISVTLLIVQLELKYKYETEITDIDTSIFNYLYSVIDFIYIIVIFATGLQVLNIIYRR